MTIVITGREPLLQRVSGRPANHQPDVQGLLTAGRGRRGLRLHLWDQLPHSIQFTSISDSARNRRRFKQGWDSRYKDMHELKNNCKAARRVGEAMPLPALTCRRWEQTSLLRELVVCSLICPKTYNWANHTCPAFHDTQNWFSQC